MSELDDFRFAVSPLYWNSEMDLGNLFRAVRKFDGGYVIMLFKGGDYEVLPITCTNKDVEENLKNNAWILLK